MTREIDLDGYREELIVIAIETAYNHDQPFLDSYLDQPLLSRHHDICRLVTALYGDSVKYSTISLVPNIAQFSMGFYHVYGIFGILSGKPGSFLSLGVTILQDTTRTRGRRSPSRQTGRQGSI